MAISGGDGSIILTTKIDEKGLNDGMKSIRNGVLTIEKNVKIAGKAMAGAFVAAGTAAIKLGADFEQSAAKASTLFGDVAVDTDNLNKKMLELSSSTGVAATELNEALYSALSAGIPATEDMSEAIGILEGSTKLAKAGFTDIDTALSATAKTLNAYGLETTEAERIQGILIQTQNKGITTVGELGATLAQVTPTAAAFNVSFENVGAALATMTAQGTPTAQATTQLNSLIAELGKQGTIASNNLMKAAEGTKYAGMSFSEMTSSGASLGDILSLIEEEAERNGVSIVDMFSSIEAGKAALSITSGEAQTFNSNLEAMADTSGLVDEAYGKVTQTLSSQTSILIESFKNLGIAIGTGGDVDMAIQNLSTSFGNFASVALPVVGQVVSGLFGAFMNLPTPILVVVGALGSLAAGITAYNTVATISSAITAAKAAVEAGEATTLWGAVAAQIGLNTAMLASPITWVVAGIAALVAAFVILWNKSEGFRNFWIGLWEAIKTAVAPVVEWIKEAFSTAWDYIKAVWEQVQPYFSAIWEGIKAVFSVVADVLGAFFETAWTAIKAVWDVVTGYFSAIWDTIAGIFSVVASVLSGNWSDAWEAIKGIVNTWANFFSGVWESIKSVFSAVGSWFTGIFSAAWNGVKNAWSGTSAFFGNVWNGITNVFSSVTSWFSSTFTSAWNGVKNAFSSVTSFFTGVWSKIKNAFKTGDMRTIGKNIVQGLWNGINDMTAWIGNKIKSFCSNALGAIKSFFGIESPSKVMRDEVGKQIPAGMAIGIDKAKNLVTKATKALVTDTRSEAQKVLDDMNEEMLESEKLYAEESLRIEQEKEEKEYNEKIKNAEKQLEEKKKNAKKSEEIAEANAKYEEEIQKIHNDKVNKEQEKSEKEYLDGLKKAAEEERKINDARQKDIENAQKNIINAYEDAANDILDAIKDLQKKQESLADKLFDFGDIMEDVEEIEDKFSDIYSPITKKDGRYVLEKLDSQTRKLEGYLDLMTDLRDREGMSAELFDVIKNMGYEESFAYAKKLMIMGDSQFSNYIESWQKKQETSKRITEELFGDDGSIGAKRVLSNLTYQTNVLKDYYSLLEQVKNRAELPEGFFDTLRDMGIEEGLEYANALLELSDEDFANYIKAWEEKQKTSQLISKELYRDEAEQLANEIGDKFDEVEKEFFGVGEKAADQFESGFIEQLKTVVSNIKGTIKGAFSNVGLGMSPNYGVDGYSIKVPALARGSVLPGGKPFLAIVNDQPRGQTNVEAPLQTIVDAMDIALNNRNSNEVVREEHYHLNETELMTILHKLVKGGERLQGKSLISGGAY